MSSEAGPPGAGERGLGERGAAGERGDGRRQPGSHPPGIAAAITEVSERASVLIREEIELAKTEIAEKATRLAKGAVVAIVAGVFFLTALFFVLIGCAWLLYYELPIGSAFTYFYGFFAMAVILVILGTIAGFLAARAMRSGAPPTPEMAIEEARKIRETVGSAASTASPLAGAGTGMGAEGYGGKTAAGTVGSPAPPRPDAASLAGMAGGGPAAAGSEPPIPPPGTAPSESDTQRGAGYGTTLGS